MVTALQNMTLEEFLRLPEDEPALEYFEGVVTQKVAPRPVHAVLQFEIALLLDRQLRPGQQGLVLPELRTTYQGASLVPDVAVYRRAREPRDTAGRLTADVRRPPDLAIEVISPGQTVRNLSKRCQWFVDNGACVALLVIPRQQAVRDFRPNAPVTIYRRGDVIDLGEVVPGLRLDLEELFAVLDPR
jgi:Uma2 family endonuclease